MGDSIETQLKVLHHLFRKKMALLNNNDFKISIVFAASFKIAWYEQIYDIINAIDVAFCHALMDRNARRAMRYYILVCEYIDELQEHCKKDILNI